MSGFGQHCTVHRTQYIVHSKQCTVHSTQNYKLYSSLYSRVHITRHSTLQSNVHRNIQATVQITTLHYIVQSKVGHYKMKKKIQKLDFRLIRLHKKKKIYIYIYLNYRKIISATSEHN